MDAHHTVRSSDAPDPRSTRRTGRGFRRAVALGLLLVVIAGCDARPVGVSRASGGVVVRDQRCWGDDVRQYDLNVTPDGSLEPTRSVSTPEFSETSPVVAIEVPVGSQLRVVEDSIDKTVVGPSDLATSPVVWGTGADQKAGSVDAWHQAASDWCAQYSVEGYMRPMIYFGAFLGLLMIAFLLVASARHKTGFATVGIVLLGLWVVAFTVLWGMSMADVDFLGVLLVPDLIAIALLVIALYVRSALRTRVEEADGG